MSLPHSARFLANVFAGVISFAAAASAIKNPGVCLAFEMAAGVGIEPQICADLISLISADLRDEVCGNQR